MNRKAAAAKGKDVKLCAAYPCSTYIPFVSAMCACAFMGFFTIGSYTDQDIAKYSTNETCEWDYDYSTHGSVCVTIDPPAWCQVNGTRQRCYGPDACGLDTCKPDTCWAIHVEEMCKATESVDVAFWITVSPP